MTDELFDELVQSVREGGAILRGEIEPSRIVTPSIRDEIDKQFAAMANDESYRILNESIAEEFAESDWDVLELTEAQDKADGGLD